MASEIIAETARMSPRGQIVIPQRIREKIGAKENELFVFTMLDSKTIALKILDRAELAEKFREIRAKSIKMSDEEIENEIAVVRANLRAKGSY